MFRKTNRESSLLECFSVPQPGVYSVAVYEVWSHKSRYLKLPNITIEIEEGKGIKCKKHFIKMFKDVGMVVPKIKETRLE